MADLIPVQTPLKVGKDSINRKVFELEAILASLQEQITSEQLARMGADGAHVNAGTAHQATQIAYDETKSVRQRVDELFGQIGNILVHAGSGNTAIDDMRLGADGVARQYPGLLIREIHAQQLQAAMQSVILKRGINIL